MKKLYVVKKSKIHGKGLYASQDIKKGKLIFKMDISSLPSTKPGDKLTRQQRHHVDYAGRGRYVVANHPYVFINHSCDPNILIKHKTIARSEFYAMRDIKKGEQFTYDYGSSALDQIDKELWKVKCNCGSKKCRGILSACFLKQPIENQRKYYKYLPLSIKRKYKDKFTKLRNKQKRQN